MSETRHVQNDYATDEIVVHWDSAKCIHSANCLNNLSDVFDVRRRPWVRVEGAGADAIAAAVDTCPSMALTYTRLDGGTNGPNALPVTETTAHTDNGTPVVISLRPDGPLVIEGKVRIELARGEVIDTTERVKLCRCGGSSNKPYCDGTHRKKGFQAEDW